MEITYKSTYFFIFFLIPLMGSILLFTINFLFFDISNDDEDDSSPQIKSTLSPTSTPHLKETITKSEVTKTKIRRLKLVLNLLGGFGLCVSIISFSIWDYVHVVSAIISSLVFLGGFVVYHFENEFRILDGDVDDTLRWNVKYNSLQEEEEEEGEEYNVDIEDSPDIILSEIKSTELIHSNNNNNNNSTTKTKRKRIVTRDKRSFIRQYISHYIFNRILKSIKSHKMAYICAGLVVVFLCVFIPLTTEGLCICSHPMKVNSRFSRRYMEPYCKTGTICFTYLTLPEDSSTSMILQYQTRDKPISSKILIWDNENNNQTISSNNMISMKDIILEEPRYISYIEITELKANTIYIFKILMETTSSHIESKLFSFKTLADSQNDTVTFATGGDIQINSDSIQLGERIRDDIRPDFIAFGGDIAYEDGIPSCYRRWDEKLDYFSKYFTWFDSDSQSQRLIPLLFAIGNHEAGGFFQSYKQIPFFQRYFIFKLGDIGIPINERSTYHIHKISNHSSLVALDSFVTVTFDQQSQWLNDIWSGDMYQGLRKYAIYHTPIYPGSVDLENKYSVNGREYIQPVFDRFNVPLVFENHEHLFKRSKSIYNGEVSSNGTVYLGGGAYGIASSSKPGNTTDLPWWLEKRSLSNHIWIVRLSISNVSSIALLPNGDILDSIEITSFSRS